MTEDSLFKQWLEVNAQVRHRERLLSERVTSTMWAMMACMGTAVLIAATQGFESALNRHMTAALMAFAAIPAVAAYFGVLSAQRQLQDLCNVRDALETQAKIGPTHIVSNRLHIGVVLAAIVLVAYAFIAGACWLLLTPQSYFDRAEPTPPMRVSLDGLSALVGSTDRLAQSFERHSSASGPLAIEGLEKLTQSVDRLAVAQKPDSSASRSVSIEGLPALIEAINRLVNRISGNITPAANNRTDGREPERIPFEAIAEHTNSTVAWVLAGTAVLLALAGTLAAVFLKAPPVIKAVVATSSLALGISGTLPLSFKGEINLRGDLSCGTGGCIRIERGGAVWSELPATPSFGIGASKSTEVASCAIPEEEIAKAWKMWRDEFVKVWLERRSPKPTDIVMLRGSADPQPLSGPLRLRYETNSGLSLARAEHVAGLLLDATASNALAEHRLDRARIVVLAGGPAGTGEQASPASSARDCSDLIKRDQRRVRIWIQATPT